MFTKFMIKDKINNIRNDIILTIINGYIVKYGLSKISFVIILSLL
jgi:hypothetical protein